MPVPSLEGCAQHGAVKLDCADCHAAREVAERARLAHCGVDAKRFDEVRKNHTERWPVFLKRKRLFPSFAIGEPVVPPPPVYRILAQDVVPGMLFHWGTGCEPARVERVTRMAGVVRLEWSSSPYGSQPQAHEQVLVSLSGPSLRELCCAPGCHLHTAPLRAYAKPKIHSPGCCVTPAEGLHGGMRLWPAPVNGYAWAWNGHGWCLDTFLMKPNQVALLLDPSTYGSGRGMASSVADAYLMAFYHQPAPPPEKHDPVKAHNLGDGPTPWDPYGDLSDADPEKGWL